MEDGLIIDDMRQPFPQSALGTRWQLSTDRVMGGVSGGKMTRTEISGRTALLMTGAVRLENNGGFVQLGLDLRPNGAACDLSAFTGVEMTVHGNDEAYGLHLRTDDCVRPWQSYRQQFVATDAWTTLRLPFAKMKPHRVDTPFDPTRMRRVGLAAIGRAFTAELAVSWLSFY